MGSWRYGAASTQHKNTQQDTSTARQAEGACERNQNHYGMGKINRGNKGTKFLICFLFCFPTRTWQLETNTKLRSCGMSFHRMLWIWDCKWVQKVIGWISEGKFHAKIWSTETPVVSQKSLSCWWRGQWVWGGWCCWLLASCNHFCPLWGSPWGLYDPSDLLLSIFDIWQLC